MKFHHMVKRFYTQRIPCAGRVWENGILPAVDRNFQKGSMYWATCIKTLLCISCDPVIPPLGIYPKINGQDVYKRIFVTQLFIIEKI